MWLVVLSGKLGVSGACPWRLHGRFGLAVCMSVEVHIDRVSSACQVVDYVGACAAMLRMGWSEEAERDLDLSREVVRSERVSAV